MLLFMSWLWSLGSSLNKFIPSELRPNVSPFKYALVYSFSYIFVSQIYIVNLTIGYSSHEMLQIYVTFHLFAICCFFYVLFFIAKNIAIYEQKSYVGFSNLSSYFFLLWIFPLGIWYLQPRINRIYKKVKIST